MEDNNTADRFRHYDADEIKTELGHVSGWVPHMNVEPLTDEIDEAEVQCFTDDGNEAFVTTL